MNYTTPTTPKRVLVRAKVLNLLSFHLKCDYNDPTTVAMAQWNARSIENARLCCCDDPLHQNLFLNLLKEGLYKDICILDSTNFIAVVTSYCSSEDAPPGKLCP